MNTFTDLAINKNNFIRIIKVPVEIVCIIVKKIYGRCLSRRTVKLCWNYYIDAQSPHSLPPQEIVSCLAKGVEIKDYRLLPSRISKKVIVEVCYRVKVNVTYRDSAGKIGVAVLVKDLRRCSGPLPGTLNMSAMADISLELLQCHLETDMSMKFA